MAKLVKYVKLGEKALSFSCPTSGVTLIPGVVRELNAKELSSKKVKMAIKGGHLEQVNEEAYKKYQKSLNKTVNEDDEEDVEFYTEKELKSKTKDTLIGIIRDMDPENEDNLEKMDKPTLIETILLLQEDEDEEEDEE